VCAGALVLALPSVQGVMGVIEYWKGNANPLQTPSLAAAMKSTEPEQACPKCEPKHIQRVAGRHRCADCGQMFGPLPEVAYVKRSDVLGGYHPWR
jgi:hypothetical protein